METSKIKIHLIISTLIAFIHGTRTLKHKAENSKLFLKLAADEDRVVYPVFC